MSSKGRGLALLAICALGALGTGCQRSTPAATDPKSLQRHADELREQHRREMENRPLKAATDPERRSP